MREKLNGLFDGCMEGRTMYVVPFAWAARLADRAHRRGADRLPYVAVNMRIMTRMGQGALDMLATMASSCPACIRSACRSLTGSRTCRGHATPKEVHRPLPRDARDLVVRLGLRRQRAARQEVLRAAIASVMARDEGWMAEHMLILKLTRPRARSR